MKPLYHATGKQVLRRGSHFADAVSEEAAQRIVFALNLLAWTEPRRKSTCQPATLSS